MLSEGGDPLSVRFIVDTWSQMIATGSGTTAQMVRRDGFVWWTGENLPGPNCTLETGDGQYRVSLNELRSQRARFYCLG